MATSLVKRIPLRVLFIAALLTALLAVPACGGDDGNGGGGPDAATGGGGDLQFMDQCDPQNDQCDTANGDMCFMFNMGGAYCTHTCTGPADCPAPSGGCNGMGICKRPQ